MNVVIKKDPDEHYWDDSEEKDKWYLGDYIPSSWIDDNGVRHITVWDEDIETRYKLKDGKVVLDCVVF